MKICPVVLNHLDQIERTCRQIRPRPSYLKNSVSVLALAEFLVNFINNCPNSKRWFKTEGTRKRVIKWTEEPQKHLRKLDNSKRKLLRRLFRDGRQKHRFDSADA